jgi:hypothetical protein
MRYDPELWRGYISGALTEEAFIQAFVEAGFYGAWILQRDEQPWRMVAKPKDWTTRPRPAPASAATAEVVAERGPEVWFRAVLRAGTRQVKSPDSPRLEFTLQLADGPLKGELQSKFQPYGTMGVTMR